MLLGSEPPSQALFATVQVPDLAAWLIAEGLGSMAHARFKDVWPELAQALRGDMYQAALEQNLRRERQARIHESFARAGIPIVPLKGAALALTVYADPAWRPMGDVDYWVPDKHMDSAIHVMQQIGYRVKISWEERPPALQRLLDGEVQFLGPDGSVVELHWSPFSGWWLQGAARVDHTGLWKRLQPLPSSAQDNGGPATWTLAPEDMLLQLAVHVSVSHKFGIWPVRSLVDIYLVATRNKIDWQTFVARAYQWRLATVAWTVLKLTQELFGVDDWKPMLRALQPSGWRRPLLRRVMPLEALLVDSDLRQRTVRFPLLLLLIDRPLDMLRLSKRMLWPERAWLRARYGDAHPGNLRHLWRIFRNREM